MPQYKVVIEFSDEPTLNDTTVDDIIANSEAEAILQAEKWLQDGFPGDAVKPHTASCYRISVVSG